MRVESASRETSEPRLPDPCQCDHPIADGDHCVMCGRSLPLPANAEGGGDPQWSKKQEGALYAICDFAERHGRPPTYGEWTKARPGQPCSMTVRNLFGTWKAAIRAAGFTPPAQGRKPKEVT